MRPHTCAIIGVLNFLQHDDKKKEFTVNVNTVGKDNREFKIDIHYVSDREINLAVRGFWSCLTRIIIENGSKFTIDHNHSSAKDSREEFTFKGREIYDGNHRPDTVSGKFKGEVYNIHDIKLEDERLNQTYYVGTA